MYHVTAPQQEEITTMVRQLITTAGEFFGRSFDMPTVTFDARGNNVAGQAFHNEWRVNFHAGYVQHFYDEYIKETIAHEVAHLITGVVYPSTRGQRVRTGSGRIKTTHKGSPHGGEWKSVMSDVFNTDPSRCHSWQLPGVVRRRAERIEYRCSACGGSVKLGPKQHKKQQQGASYSHKGCGRAPLNLVPQLIEEMMEDRLVAVAANASSPQPKPANKGTKAERSITLIRSLQRQGYPRKDIIAQMMVELDMGKPGASTYYQKYK